jgi:hypothetical protein
MINLYPIKSSISLIKLMNAKNEKLRKTYEDSEIPFFDLSGFND